MDFYSSFALAFGGLREHRGLWDEQESQFDTATNTKFQNNMDYEKAKRALATLQEEKRAQQHRLQLAVQAKQQLDSTLHTALLSGVEGQLPKICRVL